MNKIDYLILCAAAWNVWGACWFVSTWFVKPTKSREGLVLRLQHVIPSTVGLFLLFHGWRYNIFFGRLYHDPNVQAGGLIMTLAGLLLTVWARVHLGRNWSIAITRKEDHELVRSGPYQFVRHPLYTGLLLAVLGTSVVAETGDALAGFVVMLVTYVIKLRREETVLAEEFGDRYQSYRNDVPALLPLALSRAN